MLRKFAVVLSILTTLGGGAATLVSGIESDVTEIQTEFYEDESDGFTTEEKDWIWSEAMKVVDHDLSNMTFGGNSYDK